MMVSSMVERQVREKGGDFETRQGYVTDNFWVSTQMGGLFEPPRTHFPTPLGTYILFTVSQLLLVAQLDPHSADSLCRRIACE